MIGYIWARESNQDDEEIYSLKSQLDACRAAAEADSIPVTPDRTYSVQFSGRDLRTAPQLQQLREAIKRNSHEKQRVYCYTQDRLIRGEEAEDIFYLLVEFRHHNAEVKFIKNPLDMATIAGKIMALVAGHEASGEIDKIRDRTMRGKLQRIKEGKLPNYGLDKFGYKRDRATGKAEIVPEEWTILQRIKRLYLEDRLSATEVCEVFNREGIPTPLGFKRGRNAQLAFKRRRNDQWRPGVITRLLRDDAYRGTGFAWRYKSKGYNTRAVKLRPREEWIEIPNAFPPLFTPAEWSRLQARIISNDSRSKRSSETPGILRGMARCETCGHNLYPKWMGKKKESYVYYFCQQCAGNAGRYLYVPLPALDVWAWERFAAWLRGESFTDDLGHFQSTGLALGLSQEAEEAVRQIAARERQVENLLSQAREASGAVAKLLHSEIARVEAEREAINSRLREIKRLIADEAQRDKLISEMIEIRNEIADGLDLLDDPNRRTILQVFQVKILISGKKSENWRFAPLVVPNQESIFLLRRYQRREMPD